MSGRGSIAVIISFARRGEEAAIRQAIEHVTRDSPGVQLAAFGTPVSAPVLHSLGIEDVMVLGGAQGAREALRAARARRPELAVVVYSGPGTGGHLKLEALALSLPSARLRRFVPGEMYRMVTRPGLALAVAGKLVQAACCLIAGGLVCSAAWIWLRLAQLLRGGRRARRA